MGVVDYVKRKLSKDKPSYNVIIGEPGGKVYDPKFIGPRERGGIDSPQASPGVVTSDPNYPTNGRGGGGGSSGGGFSGSGPVGGGVSSVQQAETQKQAAEQAAKSAAAAAQRQKIQQELAAKRVAASQQLRRQAEIYDPRQKLYIQPDRTSNQYLDQTATYRPPTIEERIELDKTTTEKLKGGIIYYKEKVVEPTSEVITDIISKQVKSTQAAQERDIRFASTAGGLTIAGIEKATPKVKAVASSIWGVAEPVAKDIISKQVKSTQAAQERDIRFASTAGGLTIITEIAEIRRLNIAAKKEGKETFWFEYAQRKEVELPVTKTWYGSTLNVFEKRAEVASIKSGTAEWLAKQKEQKRRQSISDMAFSQDYGNIIVSEKQKQVAAESFGEAAKTSLKILSTDIPLLVGGGMVYTKAPALVQTGVDVGFAGYGGYEVATGETKEEKIAGGLMLGLGVFGLRARGATKILRSTSKTPKEIGRELTKYDKYIKAEKTGEKVVEPVYKKVEIAKDIYGKQLRKIELGSEDVLYGAKQVVRKKKGVVTILSEQPTGKIKGTFEETLEGGWFKKPKKYKGTIEGTEEGLVETIEFGKGIKKITRVSKDGRGYVSIIKKDRLVKRVRFKGDNVPKQEFKSYFDEPIKTTKKRQVGEKEHG